MSNIFDGSDSELEFKTDSEYAKNYDKWRKKEELNKLKTKYGERIDSEDSSSESDDDDDEIELSDKAGKNFFKILACLKSKDPKIYDKNVKFFDDDDSPKTKNKKTKPLYIKDYERNLLLEKEGVLSDNETDTLKFQENSESTAEQEKLNIIKSLNVLDEEEDEDCLGFAKRKEHKEKNEPEDEYKQWLAGQKYNLKDKVTEMELKPLRDYWNKSDLDEGERFVRDYILHNKFLEKVNNDYIPTYDEIVHDSDQDLSNDEETIQKQEEFEHKYNFRFEEPDEEFIKRYPRTIENSLRRKDNKRKEKRQDLKERKRKEKEEKKQEIKKLQELKVKEIEEKIEKLQEITGGAKLNFNDEDLEDDFDPEKYDQRMKELFNDEFYEGVEGDQKPEFPDVDQELEIENYQHFEKEESNAHCEDEDFNMDADYDPSNSFSKEMVENKNKKKRKRKSKFTEAVNKTKPKFDPGDKTYEEYFEEYYKLDCEDFIGDIPCRFKYKKVVPNDFGLSIEEILMAKDRELNKWCSLKKAVQIRPDHVEKYDQIAYKKKGQNITLKKKILPSLFNTDDDDNPEVGKIIPINPKENEITTTDTQTFLEEKTKFKPKKKSKNAELKASDSQKVLNEEPKLQQNKMKKSKTNVENISESKSINIENASNAEEEYINSEKEDLNKKNKKHHTHSNQEVNKHTKIEKKNSKKRKLAKTTEKQSKKLKKNELIKNPILTISDERLTSFGIKPKKFRNKLKYKTS